VPEKVRVEKSDLLERLRENRDGHREVFLRATEGFREEVVRQLDQALEEARAGRKFRTSFALPEPSDHTRDYDRVIEMLELCVDQIVELDQREFAQYVQDDWGWRPDFVQTSSQYLARQNRNRG
jgi:hypothetical protein